MLSPNGKKASDPKATPDWVSSHARFSSRVSTSGFRVKNCSHMIAGVGKSYRMLQEAHELLENGVDVQIGYVETHGRVGTEVISYR